MFSRIFAFRHVTWPLDGFDTIERPPGSQLRRRFPIRFLRYWFLRRLLEEQAAKLGRPIAVLEVGIGGGNVPAFLGGKQVDGKRRERPEWIARWDGLDVVRQDLADENFAYSNYIHADIEKPFEKELGRYDAIVMSHVLEHLVEPEAAIQRLQSTLNANGILIGGSPTMPTLLAAIHERWLRWKFRSLMDDVHTHRHLSVITPNRLRRFAQKQGMSVDLLTGTFFCRWSGLFLEDTEWWTRANLAWGALFPALGGEVYFSLRRIGGNPPSSGHAKTRRVSAPTAVS